MDAQRYRHRVSFFERVDTQNPVTGAVLSSWQVAVLPDLTELSGVPAEILTGPGREFSAADAKQGDTSARVSLRWFPGLLQSWKLGIDGANYDIQSIETDATGRREYRLRVAAGVNGGA